MTWTKVLPYLAYFGGVAFGVLWPYLRAYLETGAQIEWNKIKGKVVAAILGVFLLPTLGEVLTALGGVAWIVAFGMGVAMTTVGHEAQRTPAAISEGKRLERLP